MLQKTCLAAVLVMTATSALAHSPLKTTQPADGAELAKAPQTISMTFGKPARLTKVIVERADNAEPSRLKLPTKSFTREFEMNEIPDLAGRYRVRWRALGQDGHVLKGSFGYTVFPR